MVAREDRSGGTTGIVVIGRNEGERLRRCLASLPARAPVVYVDSGSTDRSRESARDAGAVVVELDRSRPFTAARARNAGFERIVREVPEVELVQFVDGDCELRPSWMDVAERVLRAHEDVAVVCGRRRERFPLHSVYNRLCDVEWDLPIGPVRACGGDALVRASAFRAAGGFDPSMIAGEEPDLCLRLRQRGFEILRIDAEMTLHDAAMTHWTQWWQRAVRCGHTTAELLAKYGAAREHKRLRRALSAVAWGVAMPLVALAALLAMLLTGAHVLALATLTGVTAAYVSLLARIARHCRDCGLPREVANAYALSCALAKVPETWGMLLYLARRATGRRARWIEYKPTPASAEEGGALSGRA